MIAHTWIIGERINPTRRSRLAADLGAARLGGVLREARSQARQGADALDVNVSAPGIDEVELLPRAAQAVREATGLTVCADSSSPAALRAALAVLPAGSVLNSTTADESSLDELLPVAAEHGALVIGMAKDRSGIPPTVSGRMDLARRIARKAQQAGIPGDRVLVDFLALPACIEPESTSVTLECIAAARAELGVGSVLGVSNVSYGMPWRPALNAAFLVMAIRAGLSAAIVNPGEDGMVRAILAADVLAGRDPFGRRFIEQFRLRGKGRKPGLAGSVRSAGGDGP